MARKKTFWDGASYLGQKAWGGLVGSVEGIWDFAAGGIADWAGADEWAKKQIKNDWMDYEAADRWYKPTGGMKFAGDVAAGIGNSIPALGVGLATGGAGLLPAFASTFGVSFLSAGGNAVKEAYRDTGKLTGKEWGYGALSGATEGLVEGAGTLFGLGQGAILKQFGKTAAKSAARSSLIGTLISGAAGEAAEEFVSAALDPYFKQKTYDPDAKFNLGEALYSSGVGAMSGLLMAGGGSVARSSTDLLSGSRISGDEKTSSRVINAAKAVRDFEQKNQTGNEVFEEIAKGYDKLEAELKANGGAYTISAKKQLGYLNERLGVGMLQPQFIQAAETILADPSATVESINKFYGNNDLTVEELTKGIEAKIGEKGFSKAVMKAVKSNSKLRELIAIQTLGNIELDSRNYADAIFGDTPISTVATQENINRFVSGKDEATVAAVSSALGVDLRGATAPEVAEAIGRARDNGGLEQYREATTAIREAKKVKESTGELPTAIMAQGQGAARYTVGGEEVALIRNGNSFRLYDYSSGNISNSLTAIEAIRAIQKIKNAAENGKAVVAEANTRVNTENAQRSENSGAERENNNSHLLKKNNESVKIERKGVDRTNESERIRIRSGGERSGGQNTEGQVSRMEGGTGQTESRGEAFQVADSRAAQILDDGQEVNARELGIRDGGDRKVRIVDKSKETPLMKLARLRAERRGLDVTFFVGDNLLIREGGKSISARAYIEGSKVFVRGDHALYTADQLMRHELGHDMIAKGEVNIQEVRDRLKKKVGKENIGNVAELYTEAYEGTGMTAEEIFEEFVCDSLEDMNVFASDKQAKALLDKTIQKTQKAVKKSKESAKTRGSPDGKASRTIQKAKYISYSKLGINNFAYINSELKKLYGNLKNGIADEIAIVKGDEVFIVDSGIENGKIKFGVRLKETINNESLRADYVKERNEYAISNGKVSDGLSQRLRSGLGYNTNSNLRQESRSKLQADKGKSENQQKGISGENADKRGLKGKTSRELDSEYLSAVERGDMETAQSMVDEAAKEAGYDSPKLYHGTAAFGFTEFNPELADDGISIFASNDSLVAETYSGPTRNRNISDRATITPEELEGYSAETLLSLLKKHFGSDYRIVTNAERQDIIKAIRDPLIKAARAVENFYAINMDMFNKKKREALFAVSKTIKNVANAENYDALSDSHFDYEKALWDLRWLDESVSDEILKIIGNSESGAFRELSTWLDTDVFHADADYVKKTHTPWMNRNEAISALYPKIFSGVYNLYAKTSNSLEIDAEGSYWSKIDGRKIGISRELKTRDVAKYAKDKGYNSVVIRNLFDNGSSSYNGMSDVYIFFGSNMLKSADPVTYDDNGEVIPLSERFNPKNSDIRFSRELDTEVKAPVDGVVAKARAELFNDKVYNKSEALTAIRTIKGAERLTAKEREALADTLWIGLNEKVAEKNRQKQLAHLSDKLYEDMSNMLNSEDATEVIKLKIRIFDAVKGLYKNGGHESKKAKVEAKEANVDNVISMHDEYNKATLALDRTVRSIRDKLRGSAFDNATVYNGEGIKGILAPIAAFEYRRTFSSNEVREKLGNLLSWYNKDNPMLCYETEEAPGVYLETIHNTLESLALGKSDLTVEELKSLDEVLRYFVHIAENYRKVWMDEKWIDADPLAKKYARNITKNKRDVSHVLRAYRNKYIRAAGTPETVMLAADGFTDGFFSEMQLQLKTAEVSSDEEIMEISRELDDFVNSNKKYARKLTEKTVELFGAKFSKVELMEYYMALKRKQAHEALAYNGIVIHSEDGGEGRDVTVAGFAQGKKDLDPEKLDKLAAARRAEIEKKLSEKDKRLIEIFEKCYEKTREIKSKADIARLGISNVIEGYYYPIKRAYAKTKTIDIGAEAGFVDRFANASFNKHAKENAKQPLVIGSAYDTFTRHVKGIVYYSKVSPVVDSYNKMWKLNLSANNNTPRSLETMSKQSEATWREGKDTIVGNKYFRDEVYNIMNGSYARNALGSETIGGIRGKAAVAALAANIKVMITQISSWFSASSKLSYSSLVKGLAVSARDVDQYCKLAELRNRDKTAIKASGIIDGISGVGEFLTKHISFMDRRVICRLFGACQVEVSRNGGPKLGTEENKIAAGKFLENVILETQQNAFVTTKNDMSRNGGELVKSLMMFRSDAVQGQGKVFSEIGRAFVYKKMLSDKSLSDSERVAIKKLAKKSSVNAGKAIFALMLSSTWVVGASHVMNLLFNKEKDKDKEPWAVALFDLGGNLLGGLPGIADVYEFFTTGFDIESMEMSVINDMLAAAKAAFDYGSKALSGEVEERDTNALIKNSLFTACQATGVPARNLYNTLYGLTRRFNESAAYRIDDNFKKQNYAADFKEAAEDGKKQLSMDILEMSFEANVGEGVSEETLDEFARLATTKYNVTPGGISKSITIDGESYDLTAEERETVQEIYSEVIPELNKLIVSRRYQRLDDKQKQKEIKNLLSRYRKMGYDVIRESYGAEKSSSSKKAWKSLASIKDESKKRVSGKSASATAVRSGYFDFNKDFTKTSGYTAQLSKYFK